MSSSAAPESLQVGEWGPFEHTAVVAELPQHHKHPFDRMLVAQATVERMVLLSSDTALDAYGVSRTW